MPDCVSRPPKLLPKLLPNNRLKDDADSKSLLKVILQNIDMQCRVCIRATIVSAVSRVCISSITVLVSHARCIQAI